MYSKVSKYSPEARKRMTYRSSKGKSCGYYMRIVFFFSSLIQSLIIVSLVLFLIYGQQQDSASVDRVKTLELRFNELSMETVSLRQQRKNLTHLLNVTSMERARNEWDLARLRFVANTSYILLDETEKKLQQCDLERRHSRINCASETRPPMNNFHNPFGNDCNCGLQMETLKARMQLIQSNFTQTAMQMQMEMDQMSRDRDNLNLEAIQLRRDKSVHDKAIQFYQIKCKEEFVNSLSGISNVSKAFLGKIDSLFHNMPPFHLTCPNQKEYLEQIRTNCTDLSEEVVTKFQTYLDTLGNRVSMYHRNISVLTAENIRMTRDYNLCSQNRSGLIREHRQHLQRVQLRNDEEQEKLLKEKVKLKGDIEVLESSIRLKDSQLEHKNEQLKHLNLSCIPRSGGLYPRFGVQPGSPWGQQPGSSNQGFPNANSGLGQVNRNNNFGSSSSSSSSGSMFGSTGLNTGLGLSNSGYNKPSSTGLGSSSLGSSMANKLGSSNQGSSSSSFGSPIGSSGTGLNKQTSTGLGSSSSSSLGSTFGSSNNPSSSSSSQNKYGSSAGTGTGSSNLGTNFGSSSSSLGSNYGSSSSNLGSNSGSSSNSGLGSSSSSSLSKTLSNTRGSSNTFGSSSSSGSSLGSSSSSLNKLSSSSSKGSSSSSSSSSSSGGSSATTSKSGGFGGWWGGLGGGSSSSSSSSGSSTNSDQSKLGSNQGRGTSNSGNSFGSFGSGRTFSFTGPISVNQHLRDLQRIINPPGPEEKQELSRMMG